MTEKEALEMIGERAEELAKMQKCKIKWCGLQKREEKKML